MGAKSVVLSGLVCKQISAVLAKRGYASSSASSHINVMLKKGESTAVKTTSWAPDPVTGYYRPDNHPKEIDAVELRRLLLTKTTTNVRH